jgi:hypothetical protein
MVRRVLLESLPQAALPPKLQQQQQQQLLLLRQAMGGSSAKQLATHTSPKVFAAPPQQLAAHSSTGNGAGTSTGSTGGGGDIGAGRGSGNGGSNGSSGSSSQGLLGPVEQLALGTPGCLSCVGLQPDPLLESAWRIMLNLAVVQVRKGGG